RNSISSIGSLQSQSKFSTDCSIDVFNSQRKFGTLTSKWKNYSVRDRIVMKRIGQLLQKLCADGPFSNRYKFEFPMRQAWSNVAFIPDIGLKLNPKPQKIRKLSQRRRHLLMMTLCMLLSMKQNKIYKTKRGLYYEGTSSFQST